MNVSAGRLFWLYLRGPLWWVGDTVLVLYDPANPARNEADLFEVRSDEQAELEEQADDDAGE